MVQTDKTVVAENSINQDHLLNYWAQKLFLLNLEMHTQSHPGYSSYLLGIQLGTGRMFRNVGTYNSDAGISPNRKIKIFRTG